MGSPFMQDSPSALSDPIDNPDAQNGPTTNAHAANSHVAPRGRNSPWRHLEDPYTGLPESGDFFEWINLIAYAESLGSSPENGNQNASASVQGLDNTLPNSSHAENIDDEHWDAFMNFEFSSPTGAGNTPPQAVDARYRYDSVQSNIEEPVSPREGGHTADGHDSAQSKILASANGPADSDARAIMTDAARRNLLAAKFDFVGDFDDAEWRDFMEVATVDWSELDDAPADGNAQTNGNTASNDHNPMTNGNLSTDGNVLENGDNLLQDDDALAESNLSAEWNRLLVDYNTLENPHLAGDDAVVSGDHVMTDDIFAETPYFSVNNNPLEVATRPVNEDNTMVNGDHLTTDDNSPAHLYLPETDGFLGGGSPGNGQDAVLHGDHLMAYDSFLANLYFPETDSFLGGGSPGNGEDAVLHGNHLMEDANDLTNLYLPETDSFLGGGSPGNGEDAVLHGDHHMADTNGPTNLTNGVHLQTADESGSANGILENSHVPAYDFDATDGFFSPMNTPGSTNGTDDKSRVNGSPPVVSPRRDTSPHQAESPVPASNLHPADSPLPVGNSDSTESLFSGDITQSADSRYQSYTPGAAVQKSIEQLCAEVPFPTPTYAESQKCIIRPYHIRDATALQHHANNPLIARDFSYSFPHPYTDNDAQRWILNQPRVITPFTDAETPRLRNHSDGSVDVLWGNTLNFAIASCQQHERNALLSGIGVKPGYNIRNRSAKLSFWIAEPYWGRGIATSAVGIFLRALFSRTLGLSRVTAYTLRRKTASGWQGNLPARRVLWRNKFKLEGCLRKSVFKFGEWWDQEVWAVLREDVMREPNMTGAASGGPVH